jgi:hypothetical protein
MPRHRERISIDLTLLLRIALSLRKRPDPPGSSCPADRRQDDLPPPTVSIT